MLGLGLAEKSEMAGLEASGSGVNKWNNYFILDKGSTERPQFTCFPRSKNCKLLSARSLPHCSRSWWCLVVAVEPVLWDKITDVEAEVGELFLFPWEIFPSILRKCLAVKWLLLVTEGMWIRTQSLARSVSWIFISGPKPYRKRC